MYRIHLLRRTLGVSPYPTFHVFERLISNTVARSHFLRCHADRYDVCAVEDCREGLRSARRILLRWANLVFPHLTEVRQNACLDKATSACRFMPF